MYAEKRETEAKNLLAGASGDWELVIGLEVHAQIISKSKLFSGSAAGFGGAPNDHVSFVDAAMPGMLPVINKKCVEQAIRTGLGLKAQINLKSVFDRKNYFYPDLPQGYQISQFKQPIVGEGKVRLDLQDGTAVDIGIERLHLEQDAGKSLHDRHDGMSHVDLNRSGVALMEIVSYPDIRSIDEAKAYVTKLRSILRYLGTCDGNMDEGSMRADVNVSVRRPGEPFGTRCEIKNVNSIRFMGQAIAYEAARQIDVLEEGGKIIQETRPYDPARGETRPMRSKEEAHDYRYFHDPDLLPLKFEQSWVDEIAASLPELPDEKKLRFINEMGLSAYDAEVLVADAQTAWYFEEVATSAEAKPAANWVINEVLGRMNKEGLSFSQIRVPAAASASILRMVSANEISGKIAKELFDIIWHEGGDPAQIVEQRGMKQLSDTGALEKIIDDIIGANQDKAAGLKEKPKMMGWFVGQVMQASKGKANPKIVNEILRKKLL